MARSPGKTTFHQARGELRALADRYHDFQPGDRHTAVRPDRSLIKFHNLWTIEAARRLLVLFTHPFNRFDLPFTTLTGWVDCDRYHDNWIHFPAIGTIRISAAVLPKGTPIAPMHTDPSGKIGWHKRRAYRRRDPRAIT